MKKLKFGVAKNSKQLYYKASFKGPLVPLKRIDEHRTQLVAIHHDEKATLNLTESVQPPIFDTSVVPNKVSGEASFFSKDGKDMLYCQFYGEAPLKEKGKKYQMVYAHVIFTGGTGRFEKATGIGSVEAELYIDKGYSQGKIKGIVIIPKE